MYTVLVVIVAVVFGIVVVIFRIVRVVLFIKIVLVFIGPECLTTVRGGGKKKIDK